MAVKAAIRQIRDILDMYTIWILIDHSESVAMELQVGNVVCRILVDVIALINDCGVFHLYGSRRLKIYIPASKSLLKNRLKL